MATFEVVAAARAPFTVRKLNGAMLPVEHDWVVSCPLASTPTHSPALPPSAETTKLVVEASCDTESDVVVALVRSVLPVRVVDARMFAKVELKAPLIVEEPVMVSAVPVALVKRVLPVRVVEARMFAKVE